MLTPREGDDPPWDHVVVALGKRGLTIAVEIVKVKVLQEGLVPRHGIEERNENLEDLLLLVDLGVGHPLV
jgi:N-acetylglutamate synthase (N-acetylornithine aminotransferase)